MKHDRPCVCSPEKDSLRWRWRFDSLKVSASESRDDNFSGCWNVSQCPYKQAQVILLLHSRGWYSPRHVLVGLTHLQVVCQQQ